ncbi:MAG: HAMP domain-containing sensor histidine kinase, partial [Aestuariivirga sp.]
MLSKRLFKTVSFQLTVFFGLIFAFCFLSLLAVIYWTTTTALRGQMQTEIRAQLNAMASEAETDGIETVVQDIKERTAQSDGQSGYYFLSDRAGLKLAGNLDGIDMRDGWRESGLGDFSSEKSGSQADEDDQVWGQGVHLSDGSFLLVGQDAVRVLSAQEAIVNSFAWSAGIAFVLATLSGIIASRGFLRRIDDINNTSLAIIDGRLKERIPVRGTSDEIDRLSANLNRLFDSNQSLLESLKQVSSNIAHDLRTPLSRLRQGLEEARAQTGNQTSHEAAIDAAIAESDQLLATFAALLRIAQIESGSRKAGFKTVDLTGVFERVANALQAVAEDQGKDLVTSLEPNVKFQGDGELLLQMAVNLVENAIRHTPPGTRIVLSLANSSGAIVASIADSGPGIPAEQRARVFEHFYRLDTSRATPGNGLGLPLVSAVATLHGIHIALQDNAPGL